MTTTTRPLADDPTGATGQDALFARAMADYGPALERLARGYEADTDLRRDLSQEIQVALWRSLAGFAGRCSLRTWVYRVAHNVAASHALAGRRRSVETLVDLEGLEGLAAATDTERAVGEQQALARLMTLIQRLKPVDRQVVLLWLEDLDAAGIGEVTGLTPGAVTTKLHRAKAALAAMFRMENPDVR